MPGPKQVRMELAEVVLRNCQEQYVGLDVQHFHEKLREECGIAQSYTRVEISHRLPDDDL